MTRPENARELAGLMLQDEEARRFLLPYKFAIDEMMTKLNILKEESSHARDHSPIEHLSSRLKSPESILAKARRQGHGTSFEEIRENIRDIAGVRIVCGFISDTYKVFQMLTEQDDVTVLRTKDYIRNPKPNGYKSLHVILRIPVFMAEKVQHVSVEVQIRTIAMDFWASLEHRIYYKYDRVVPRALLQDLREAAAAANRLDREMEQIHDEVARLHPDRASPRTPHVETVLERHGTLDMPPADGRPTDAPTPRNFLTGPRDTDPQALPGGYGRMHA